MESGENPFHFVGRLVKFMRPHLQRHLGEVQAACDGADGVVFSPLAFAGWHVAEALGVPSMQAALQPAIPTRAFPTLPLAGRWDFGGALNLLTYVPYQQFVWHALRPILNRWRRESLGIPAVPLRGPFRTMRERRTPVLHGFSPLVLPRPRDWPEWVHLTGYWFLDRPTDWQPAARVVEFLAAGPPPVYVGFGSMIPRDPAGTIDAVLGALRQAGVRGILATGWMGATAHDLPDDVLALDEIPHDWLFPRVAAVVHHGGAGTTAAAMRAGRPAVVVPFFADQPFWAQRVERLGVGPSPVPLKRLTANRLAEAIRAAVTDDGITRRAADIGEQLRAEDGVGNAVGIVDRVLRGGDMPAPDRARAEAGQSSPTLENGP
jgi:UDP:flavonoid glycosyltransferase YjiC (YdhE family)